MYATTEEYKSKVYQTKHLLKVYLDGVEIAGKYILGYESSHILFSNDEFVLGSVPSQAIDLKLFKSAVPDIVKNVYIESGIAGGIIPIGYFNVDDKEEDKDTITYKLLDNMIKFEFNYDGSPLVIEKGEVSLLEVLQDICSKAGVELGSTSFLNDDKKISVYDSTVSARTYIGYIAEQAGGFACIGRDGKLYIKTLGKDTQELSSKYLKDFTWGEQFIISRIQYEDGTRVFEKGDKTNNSVYINQENMFIVDQEQIDNIYNNLNGFEAYGFTGETNIDPALDLGDILVIDGKRIIYQGSCTYSGRLRANISSKIQSKAKEETTTKSPSTDVAIRRVESKIEQQEGKITELIQETAGQSEKITTVEKSLNGVTTRVSSVEDDIEAVEENIKTVDDKVGTLDENVKSEVANLQSQIDGAIQFWNGAEIPTLNNEPALSWGDDETARNNHRADIYTVIKDIDGEMKQGKSYRFDKVGDTWTWVELTDNELSAVQALAASKAKVFVIQPTVPYNVGDLWLNNEEIYECITAKDGNGKYSVSDWEKATKYTDDTVALLAQSTANTAINNQTITATTEEGKTFHLIDSADNNCKSVEIFGESTQETRSGKNFLNVPKEYVLNQYEFNVPLVLKAGSYILSAKSVTSDGTQRSLINFKDIDGNNKSVYLSSTELSVAVTFEKDITEYSIYSQNNYANSAGITTTFTELMLSTDGGEYEEYGAMPSLDFPSAIESIGEEITFTSIGKNFLNVPSEYEVYQYVYNVPLSLKAGTYILSAKDIVSDGNINKLFQFIYEDGTKKGFLLPLETLTVNIVLEQNVKGVDIYANGNYANSAGITTTFNNLMLRKNIDDNSYEEHRENIVTLPLLHDLNSLPNGTRDRIYRDNSTGKWYDEQKIIRLLLNGSEAWTKYNAYNTINQLSLTITNLPKYWGTSLINENSLMCSHFKSIPYSSYWTKIDTILFALNNKLFVQTEMSLEEFITWLSSNNTEVLYELAEPIVTEITDDTIIAALESIRTFRGITNIESDTNSIITYYRNVAFVDEYETKQNAEKQYKTTVEKFAEQEITNEAFKTQVGEVKTTMEDNYATKEEMATKFTETAKDFEFAINTAITELKENGVSKVVTTTVKIDDNGLTTGRSDSDFTNTMNNTGNYQYHAGELIAKYDKDGADIPRLKSDIAIIAGLKSVREEVDGIVHHKTYVLE